MQVTVVVHHITVYQVSNVLINDGPKSRGEMAICPKKLSLRTKAIFGSGVMVQSSTTKPPSAPPTLREACFCDARYDPSCDFEGILCHLGLSE